MSPFQNLPPIVVECPSCGERYLISGDQGFHSEKAIYFSDSFYLDEFNWRTPEIIGCVTCELGFFPETGKIIATPDWDEFYKNWSHLKQALPPSAGSLVLELRARKNMELSVEKILRKELWYSALHTETGKALLANNMKFKNFWVASLERLENMLVVEDNEEKILKAEVNRQLGRFNTCLEIIDQLKGKLPEAIKSEALKGNSLLFTI